MGKNMSNQSSQINTAFPPIDRTNTYSELKKLTVRELMWAASYLKNKYRINIKESNLEDLIEYIAELIISLDAEIGAREFNHLLMSRSNILVPERHISWLIDDYRAQAFTYFYLNKNYKLPYSLFHDNTYMHTIYCYLDTAVALVSTQLDNTQYVSIVNTEDKTDMVLRLELMWKQIIDHSNYDKWLKKQDAKYLDWIYDYVKKNTKAFVKLTPEVESFKKFSLILATLDTFDLDYIKFYFSDEDYKPSADKLRFVDNMKRALSQQKYRDAGKTKKPYHLPMTKVTKARLDEMAEVQSTSSTKLLESLINSVYEKEYLDEQGKKKY